MIDNSINIFDNYKNSPEKTLLKILYKKHKAMKTRFFLTMLIFLFNTLYWGQNKKFDSQKDNIEKQRKEYRKQEKDLKIALDSLEEIEKKNNLKKTIELTKKIDSLQKEKSKYEGTEKPINSRISFVIGIGGSYSLDNVYQMPIVSNLDNSVKIELGQKERLTATLGIVYTPFIYRIFDNEHPEGFLAPKGISFVGFFNPISILKNSNLEDNFSLSNFGIGIGWKSVTGIGIYGVFEMYSVKQPRQWFLDEFKDGNKAYKPNGNIQSSFSPDDNNIFRNKLIPSIGIKICYSFDIIRSFASVKGE